MIRYEPFFKFLENIYHTTIIGFKLLVINILAVVVDVW